MKVSGFWGADAAMAADCEYILYYAAASRMSAGKVEALYAIRRGVAAENINEDNRRE